MTKAKNNIDIAAEVAAFAMNFAGFRVQIIKNVECLKEQYLKECRNILNTYSTAIQANEYPLLHSPIPGIVKFPLM